MCIVVWYPFVFRLFSMLVDSVRFLNPFKRWMCMYAKCQKFPLSYHPSIRRHPYTSLKWIKYAKHFDEFIKIRCERAKTLHDKHQTVRNIFRVCKQHMHLHIKPMTTLISVCVCVLILMYAQDACTRSCNSYYYHHFVDLVVFFSTLRFYTRLSSQTRRFICFNR